MLYVILIYVNFMKVIIGSIGAAMCLSFFTVAIQAGCATVPKTLSKEWVETQKEYMKFQKMNPIFGIIFKHTVLMLHVNLFLLWLKFIIIFIYRYQ